MVVFCFAFFQILFFFSPPTRAFYVWDWCCLLQREKSKTTLQGLRSFWNIHGHPWPTEEVGSICTAEVRNSVSELRPRSSCPRDRDIWQGPAVIYLLEQSTCRCLHTPEQDIECRGVAQCLRLYEGLARDKVSNLWMYCSSHHHQQSFISKKTEYGTQETEKKELNSENSERSIWGRRGKHSSDGSKTSL